jgi:transcriptional antiterminator
MTYLARSERPRAGSPGNTQYLALALQLCEEQSFMSLNQLAKAIGCSYFTVRNYWNGVGARPEFQEAFKNSRQRAVDQVKERAFQRAMSEDKPSDLMSIYLMNNFDEEIIDRLSKNRDATITIKLEVPQQPTSIDSWATEVESVKQLRAAPSDSSGDS